MAEDTEKGPKMTENTNTEDSSVGKAQEPSGYSYDVAEDTIENKKGQLHIKVQKSIDETEQTSIISETTTCEYKSEKRTQNDTTNVIYRYDSLSGNSEHTTEFSNASTFNRKGILKTSTERHSEHTVHERGAFGLSQGLTEPIEYGYNSVKKYTFDKNNNITSTHQHYNTTASSGSCVSDEYATYNRDNLETCLRVDGKKAGVIIKSLDNKKNQNFEAHITLKKGENYSYVKKNQMIEIRIDSQGNTSGESFSLDDSKQNVTGEGIPLSQKDLKKELKIVRKKVNKIVAAVSNAKTPEEYMQTIPTSSADKTDLSSAFNADMSKVAALEPTIQKDNEQQIAQNKSLSASVILQKKIKEANSQ